MSLPIRGTGLRKGRAGARRYGVPRTEAQRYARHYGATLQASDTALYLALASLGIGALLIGVVVLSK